MLKFNYLIYSIRYLINIVLTIRSGSGSSGYDCFWES